MLRPLRPDDYQLIYETTTDYELCRFWRTQGRQVSPSGIEQLLFDGVDHRMVSVDAETGQPVALLELLSMSSVHRHAELSVLQFHGFEQTGLALESVLLFCDQVFAQFNVDKICAQVSEPAMEALGRGVAQLFEREGLLKEHVMLGGNRCDVHLFALHRTAMEQRVSDSALLRAAGPNEWSSFTIASKRSTSMTDAAAFLRGLRDEGILTDRLWESADSLTVVEVLYGLEDRLGRPIETEALLSMRSFDDLMLFIEEQAQHADRILIGA